MALTRVLSEFTFKSSAGGQTYHFNVTVDEQSRIAVRNVKSPLGLIRDPMTSLPQAVMADVDEALVYVQTLSTHSEAYSGTLTFEGDTSKEASIPSGTLNNVNYRVAYTTDDGIALTTTDQTTTSFTANTAAAYGSADVPKTVTYSVLVAPAQVSSTSGQLTFDSTTPDNQVSVTFDTALTTTGYRVILTPDGFYPVRVVQRAKTGFTVQLGITPPVGESFVVGYDVFV